MAVNISAANEHQVQAYLRFAKQQRETSVREVELVFSDVKDYKLDENVYTKDDVKELLDSAAEETRTLFEKELEHAMHASGLLLKLLLAQAESAGTDLSVDTNKLQDEILLRGVKASEREAMSKPAAEFMRKPAALTMPKMPKLMESDTKLVAERDALKAEVEKLRERFVKLQDKSVSAMREKREISSKTDEFEQQLAKEREEAAKMASSLTNTHQTQASLQAENQRLKAELAAAKDSAKAAEGRVNESKQFQQMKKMMMEKSKQLQVLRKKLNKYEPDDKGIKDADVDNLDDEFAI